MKYTKSFYSPAEVAEMAGVHPSTVLNYISSGRLYAVRLSERTIRVPGSEWDAAKEAADANGETISDVIRAALRRYVARNSRRAAS